MWIACIINAYVCIMYVLSRHILWWSSLMYAFIWVRSRKSLREEAQQTEPKYSTTVFFYSLTGSCRIFYNITYIFLFFINWIVNHLLALHFSVYDQNKNSNIIFFIKFILNNTQLIFWIIISISTVFCYHLRKHANKIFWCYMMIKL